MDNPQSVRTRFAPSPTGYFHVGGARTALFTWLTAWHAGGKVILRIEDTDRTRYNPDSLQDLMAGLRWLGLQWDEGPEVGGSYGPYFQSERTDLYAQHAVELLEKGKAYRCFCTQERLEEMRKNLKGRDQMAGYDGHCRSLSEQELDRHLKNGDKYVVRLKAPRTGDTAFEDLIRGRISVANESLDDIVLLKSDGYPTYHLANVVDDHWMEITHVTRSSEWIPSTPKHILLYQAFGWKPPIFAHLPVILDPTGKGKMSKRKQESDVEHLVHVREFRAAGYLPEALINYLALLGWATEDSRDLFTFQELVEHFELTRVNPSGAAFSYDKLDWMNGYYIRELPPDEFALRLGAFYREQGTDANPALVREIAPLIQKRVKVMREVLPLTELFFKDQLEYDSCLLIPKKGDWLQVTQILDKTIPVLTQLNTKDAQTYESTLRSIADQLGINVRPVCHVVRVAVGGGEVGPPLYETLAILGPETIAQRLKLAEQKTRAACD